MLSRRLPLVRIVSVLRVARVASMPSRHRRAPQWVVFEGADGRRPIRGIRGANLVPRTSCTFREPSARMASMRGTRGSARLQKGLFTIS